MLKKKAVVLLSGGLDSTTVVAIAEGLGYEVYALSFDYGQNHRVELESAERVAKSAEVAKHIVIKVDLRAFGGSSLTTDEAVPKNRSHEEMGTGVPSTYVPARNTVFLSLALAWAETLQANDIFIGVNALDYSGYPDCRPEFIAAYEALANVATAAGTEGGQRLTIHAPLMSMTKADIVTEGMRLGVDYSKTISCYDPSASGEACGECDACTLRLKGFAEAGYEDPAPYRKRSVA